MDFTRALTFPFDDDEWLKKLGIGVIISLAGVLLSFLVLIPLLAMAVLFAGWRYEIMKRVKNNDPVPLPDWDFGALFSKGLTLFGAQLVYQIPTIIFACIASVIWLLPLLGANSNNSNAAGALAGVSGIIIICCSCIIVLYAIVAAIVYFGGLIRFLDNEQFSTFFQFGDNIAIVRNNAGDFGMVLLYLILAGAIASVASSITFGLGGLLTTTFMSYFAGHILGQLATKLGSPATPMV